MKPSEFIEKKFSFAMGVISKAFKGTLYKKLDERFIDKEKLIDIDLGTCLGLEVFKIQKMIDFFRKEGFSPYEWEKFEEEMKLRRKR